jgi:hypothetical protein
MPDGTPVYPKSDSIIPAGTRVQISRIEWPDLKNYINRPLLTPRDMPWMKMTVAMDRGQVSLLREQTFIFLLPIHKDNVQYFADWFRTIFSEEDTNPWLLGLKEEARKAVLGKKAIIGMPHDALFAALGEPDSLSRNEGEQNGRSTTKEVATYSKQVVTLLNGVVTDIQARTPSTPEQAQSAKGKGKG